VGISTTDLFSWLVEFVQNGNGAVTRQNLLALMTGIQCRAGTTQIERVLRHALQEALNSREFTVSCMWAIPWKRTRMSCVQLAGQLGLLN